MSIRAVIFDIGGVLELTTGKGVLAKWEQRKGLSAGEYRKRWDASSIPEEATLGKLSEQELVKQWGDLFELSEPEMLELMNEMWARYSLNTEMAHFAQSLRPRYRTATLSNAFPYMPRKEREQFRFHELVDIMIYSCEEGMEKPDPRIFQLALDRLGVQPQEAVFIDDVPASVEGARKLGIWTVLFTDTAGAIRDIQAILDEHP